MPRSLARASKSTQSARSAEGVRVREHPSYAALHRRGCEVTKMLGSPPPRQTHRRKHQPEDPCFATTTRAADRTRGTEQAGALSDDGAAHRVGAIAALALVRAAAGRTDWELW